MTAKDYCTTPVNQFELISVMDRHDVFKTKTEVEEMSGEKKGSFKGRGKAEESWGYSDEERKRRERKQSSIRSRLQARQHL